MDERESVKWLHRRAGFGLPPAQMRTAIDRGFAAELELLLSQAEVAKAVVNDPWDDASLPLDPMDGPSRRYAIASWIDHMVRSEQPLVDRVTWLWHGHFVSALDKVRIARLMVDQIRLFRMAGLGGLQTLLRSVTIDAAMLDYLDGRSSTGSAPNENYPREFLELFTIGGSNFVEADVKAGASALSGWTFARGGEGVVFRPARHDDTAHRYLGIDGVHDLDTVIAAVMAHPALPSAIADTVSRQILGSNDPEMVDALASEFVASGFVVADLVRAALTAGAELAWSPLVMGPLPWFVIAARTVAAAPAAREVVLLLRAAGQLPMLPPNVAGWPGGATWFNSGSLVARANLAAVVAQSATDEEVLAAATGDDADVLADVLGLPSTGFDAQSRAALSAAPAGRDRLAVALVAPEFIVA